MRYIQRDENGVVVAHFANPQPYAQEEVSEDHPDILAWKQKIKDNKQAYMDRKAKLDPEKLLKRIEELEQEFKKFKKG